MARTMPPLAVPSSLVRDDAGDAGGLSEEASLGEAVLAGGRVHDEQRLVGRAGDEPFSGAAHLVELFHEVGLGVEAAGGVDEENACGAGFGGGAGVVERGGGIAALAGLDDLDAGALGPDLKLLDGGGAGRYPRRRGGRSGVAR